MEYLQEKLYPIAGKMACYTDFFSPEDWPFAAPLQCDLTHAKIRDTKLEISEIEGA